VFLQVEHRPPDGNPCPALLLEHPQIPAGCTISFAGTLIDHLISKGGHSRIAGDIKLMIMLAEFLHRRVLAEIAKPRKKFFPSLDPPGKIGKDHDNLRMQHRGKVLDLAVQPRLVDSTHGRSRILAFGFVYHELLLLISARAFDPPPAD